MKAYLFGSIFYEKDIMYNEMLAKGIRQAWPGIDMYVPQEALINDKKTFADSTLIYQGDYNRLKDTDLLIGCLDSDLCPIGSATELGIFSEISKNDSNKHTIVLLTDTRDAAYTASDEKINDMRLNQAASQFNYFNLFTRGTIENNGVIVRTPQQLFEYVYQLYKNYTKTHKICGIYKITNRLKNKSYIGLSIDVYKRWKEHYGGKDQLIDMAIKNDGIENFTFEILEECEESKLSEREKYWADEYYCCNTYVPNGYNVALTGARTQAIGKVVSSYDLDGLIIKTYPSLHEAARDNCVDPTAIFQAIDSEGLSNEKQWRYGNGEFIPPYVDETIKPCYVTSLYGEILQSFDSRVQAAKWIGCNTSQVINAITKKYSMYDKYYVFNLDEEYSKDLLANKNSQIIYCYDKTTRIFIKEYSSQTEASKDLGVDRHKIAHVCNGLGYYCENYILSYLKYDKIPANFKELNYDYYTSLKPKVKPKSNIKVIYQYDADTRRFIKEYPCAKAASESLNKYNGGGNIIRAANGEFKTIYGFIWSYIKWDVAPNDYQKLNQDYKKEGERINND